MQKSQMADCEVAGGTIENSDHLYISPDKIEITQFAPSEELSPFVTQFYLFRCEEDHIHGSQPAALGHLVFILRGEGSLRFFDGHVDPAHRVSLFGPCSAAAEYSFKGPLYDFGVALSPLGFVALTGKSASAYADRLVAASELFGPEIDILAARFQEGLENGTVRLAQMVAEITEFLMNRVKTVPPAHVHLVKTVIAWISSNLDPDVENLYSQLDISRSTAVRLITRYFGSAPKPLMRKYRAIRAASILCDPACTPALRQKVEASFYDQPHMIREIRHFAGRTPGALDGDDCKILRIWLSKNNYRDVAAYPG